MTLHRTTGRDVTARLRLNTARFTPTPSPPTAPNLATSRSSAEGSVRLVSGSSTVLTGRADLQTFGFPTVVLRGRRPDRGYVRGSSAVGSLSSLPRATRLVGHRNPFRRVSARSFTAP